MSISYAGVELAQTTPQITLWIEHNITPADVYQWERWAWPGVNRQHWAFRNLSGYRKIKVNTLYWPTTASRFAVGHFLATEQMLGRIRQRVHTNGALQYAFLNLTNKDNTGLEAKMWLLPPRPLAQLHNPPPGTPPDLSLLTLVDSRFLWWLTNTGVVGVDEGVTTWADLFTQAKARLTKNTFTQDAIPAAYLTPPLAVANNYEAMPLYLDMLAYNVGQRVVADLDGDKIIIQSAASAKLAHEANFSAAPIHTSGGEFHFEDHQRPGSRDLIGHVPQSVTVTFPDVDLNGVATGTYTTKVVLLTSLALGSAYLNVVGVPGTKTFHDSVAALPAAANDAALTALANQIATDYYKWQLGRMDIKFPGIVKWNADGLTDNVEWTYRGNEVSTRVQCGPFLDTTEELLHCDGASVLKTCCLPCCPEYNFKVTTTTGGSPVELARIAVPLDSTVTYTVTVDVRGEGGPVTGLTDSAVIAYTVTRVDWCETPYINLDDIGVVKDFYSFGPGEETTVDSGSGELVIAYSFDPQFDPACGPYLVWNLCVKANTCASVAPIQVNACPLAHWSRIGSFTLTAGDSGASPDCDSLNVFEVDGCLNWNGTAWVSGPTDIVIVDSDAIEYPCTVIFTVGFDGSVGGPSGSFYCLVTDIDGNLLASEYIAIVPDLTPDIDFLCKFDLDEGDTIAIAFTLDIDPALCGCPYPQQLILTASLETFSCP